MSRYDDDESRETKTIKGKVVSVKKNRSYESSSGKEYKAHLLTIETSSGDERKYKVGTQSKAAEFVKGLEEGEKVTIKKGGKYDSVLAVFKGDGKFGDKYARTNSRGGFKSDPTGAIQGMVLKAAIDIARTSSPSDKKITIDDIIDAAKLVLLAKDKTDKLVRQALKPKDDDDDDSDSDENKDDESDEDSDEEKPKKKKHSKTKDEDPDEDEPY